VTAPADLSVAVLEFAKVDWQLVRDVGHVEQVFSGDAQVLLVHFAMENDDLLK